MNPYQFYRQFKPFHLDGYSRVQENQSLIKDIQKAINGEYSAIACYKKLAKLAPTEEDKNHIREIRKDEMRHFKAFSDIYTNITGVPPTPQLQEGCPDAYKRGLEIAIKDEQESVDFYLEIADRAQDTYIKESFRRAAADEQNHAVWFLFFFIQNRGNRRQERQMNYGAKGALDATSLTVPQMLVYAMQDEYLAQARYDRIIQNFGSVQTFTRIKEAELRHITALQTLFQRYGVPLPEDNSQAYTSTPDSIKSAYAAGVQGEIDNIAMYNKFLTYNLPQDVRIVFTQLRNASQNHLAAFERGLAR
ncbi:ferritin family protein [Rossellomorea yichunensis]|uniref:ferritin family protein n=1 Tax=Rossellomorea yichunensis TaxID=3077331 RepID=UPI0028DF3C4F|nr:ferritin family protein [Rossellomorea sp. YC4-1]MDT9024168.1 ferritin family protein [Rossellomorea sp. YC4-1]